MDLQLAFKSSFFDLALAGADLATDAGLQTAVVVSLFTDRRAEAADVLPGGGDDRRGWWGDAFAEVPGDRIGSRLWLLGREKSLPKVARTVEEYTRQALQWLIDDGIAKSIEVFTELQGPVLALGGRIFRPDGSIVDFRFANLWEAMNAVSAP